MCRPDFRYEPTANPDVGDIIHHFPQNENSGHKIEVQTLQGRILRGIIMLTIYPRVCVLVALLVTWAFACATLLCAVVKSSPLFQISFGGF